MTGNQPRNFGNELDPLAWQNRDRLDRADRDTVAAAGAGRGVDDRAFSLAGKDTNGGVIADFRATAATHALLLDANIRGGQNGHQR